MAEKGSLPHTIHGTLPPTYWSVDAPLYYPILLKKLVSLTGNLKLIRKLWKGLKAIFEWGLRRDRDKDGLIETWPVKGWETDGTWMDTEKQEREACRG